MRPAQVYAAIQKQARARGRASDELLTLYGLERFLARLSATQHANDFVLKGGVLLAAYSVRRPTRDIDVQALDFPVDEAHLRAVVEAVSAVVTDDALVLEPAGVAVEQIRDAAEYSGLRVTVPAKVSRFTFVLKLDVSTGDPIYPAPETIELPSILDGDQPVRMLGHPMPMVVAEKTVTMLQRGTTSTRWRDLVDVCALARAYAFSAVDLGVAIAVVAEHRQVTVRSLAPGLAGYGASSQAKWAAWLRAQGMADRARADLDDQVADVLAFVDPVFAGEVGESWQWDPDARRWAETSGPAKRP